MNTDRKMSLARAVLRMRPLELASFLKWMLHIKRIPYVVDGVQLMIDPVCEFGRRLISDQYYEPGMTSAIRHILSEGDTFIDVGANEGYYSVIAAEKVGKRGRVVSIEPQQRLWPVFFKNIHLNEAFLCEMIPYAVSDAQGIGHITLTSSINSGAASLVNSFRSRFWPRQEVQFISLDKIFDAYNIQEAKLMKIDIEGYELNALRSARVILEKKRIETILIEIHPIQLKALKQSPDAIFDYLRALGYSYHEHNGVHIFTTSSIKTTKNGEYYRPAGSMVDHA